MKKLFDECKNHIEDDHLLLRLLVFLSSEDDIDVLLSTAPIHIVALHISDLWETRNIAKKVCTCVTRSDSIDAYKMLCCNSKILSYLLCTMFTPYFKR